MPSAYDDRIYSERLLGLTKRCSECGATMRSNGYLSHFRLPGVSIWGIEFECPNEGVTFTSHEVDRKDLIDSVVREAGKQ